jgi:hypothetical protein
MQAAQNDSIPPHLLSNIPVNTLKSDRHPLYENLVGRSVGLKSFDLLGPDSMSRMDVSSFGCVNSLAL